MSARKVVTLRNNLDNKGKDESQGGSDRPHLPVGPKGIAKKPSINSSRKNARKGNKKIKRRKVKTIKAIKGEI